MPLAQGDQAQPVVGFENVVPPTFTFPIPGSNVDVVSFYIFSKSGEISSARVIIKDIKDSKGQSRLTDEQNSPVQPSLEPNKITADGSRVVLKLNPAFFSEQGEYNITLLLRGTAGSEQIQAPPISVTITHPAADVNAEELKDQTVQLWRASPWGTASGQVSFSLIETSGKSDLHNLRLTTQSIYTKEKKILVPGSAAVGYPGRAGETPVSIEAHGSRPVEVSLAGLEQIGTFVTQLYVNSPALASTKIIPLNINVSDQFGYALAVIFLGVLGGFLANYLAQQYRPRQLINYQAVKLRGEVERLRENVTAPAKSAKLGALLTAIQAAEEKGLQSDFSAARTQLGDVEKAIEEFRKAEAEDKQKVLDDFNGLQNLIQSYVEQVQQDMTADEPTRLEAVRDRLKEVDGLLWSDRVDDAKKALSSARNLFGDLRGQRFKQALERLEGALIALGEVVEPEKQKIQDEMDQVRSALNRAEVDFDAQRTKLEQIGASLLRLKGELQRGARETLPGAPPVRLPGVITPAAPADRTRLEVEGLQESWTTDNWILFRIEDPEGIIQPGDKLTWDFGRQAILTRDYHSKSERYRFSQPRTYEVKVLIEPRDPNRQVRQLTRAIEIRAGQTESTLQHILKNLQTSDLTLSLIALILASLTGLLYLYVDKNFGSFQDYLLAFLWGFGIDNSIRGFASVMKHISAEA
jgi:hypothetical protein